MGKKGRKMLSIVSHPLFYFFLLGLAIVLSAIYFVTSPYQKCMVNEIQRQSKNSSDPVLVRDKADHICNRSSAW